MATNGTATFTVVQDAPGLVLGRIVCQVINEAAFALGEALGSAQDIDTGMVHGLNYPRGILAWADVIGLDHVLSVLDGLYLERGEERVGGGEGGEARGGEVGFGGEVERGTGQAVGRGELGGEEEGEEELGFAGAAVDRSVRRLPMVWSGGDRTSRQ